MMSNYSLCEGYVRMTSPGDGGGGATELRAVSGLIAAISCKLSTRDVKTIE